MNDKEKCKRINKLEVAIIQVLNGIDCKTITTEIIYEILSGALKCTQEND